MRGERLSGAENDAPVQRHCAERHELRGRAGRDHQATIRAQLHVRGRRAHLRRLRVPRRERDGRGERGLPGDRASLAGRRQQRQAAALQRRGALRVVRAVRLADSRAQRASVRHQQCRREQHNQHQQQQYGERRCHRHHCQLDHVDEADARRRHRDAADLPQRAHLLPRLVRGEQAARQLHVRAAHASAQRGERRVERLVAQSHRGHTRRRVADRQQAPRPPAASPQAPRSQAQAVAAATDRLARSQRPARQIRRVQHW